jgi:uncharacterized surface protein with fasciclin (FAS1) repeats
MATTFFLNRSPQRCVLLALLIPLFLGACKKTTINGPAAQTLQQYFSSAGQYTLFNQALQKTHLDTLLGGSNPYTVFAVADSAMIQAGYSAAGIDSANIAALTGVLRYHLVAGVFDSSSIQLYQETPLTTTDSSYLAYLEYNNFGLFYNGIRLVSGENTLVNGIAEGIQTMAKPPIGDLVTTIARTHMLSDYSYLVSQAGVLSQIVPYISGQPNNPITVFLPDNSFFASVGLDSYTAILQSNGGGAQAYMTNGLFFTSDFMGENAVPQDFGTIQQGQLWFSNDGYSFVLEQSSFNQAGQQDLVVSSPTRIVLANIVATNGIIHVIEPVN